MRRVFRIVPVVLVLLLFAALPLSASALYTSTGGTSDARTSANAGSTAKVLFIGNSHTRDSTAYLYDIAAAAGYDNMVIARAYINAGSLKTHNNNLYSSQPLYTYQKFGKYMNYHASYASLPSVVSNENWDIIIIQERTEDAGNSTTDSSAISTLVSGLRGLCKNPNVRFGWFMSFAYAADYSGVEFEKHGYVQETMYNAIVNNVQTSVVPHPDIEFIIPVGTALQNARSSYLGTALNSDGNHLASPTGMYLGALCHFRALTGMSLSYRQTMLGEYTALPKEEWPLFRDAVEGAVSSPFSTTPSAYTEPVAAPYYSIESEEVVISPIAQTYYYAAEPLTPMPSVRHGDKILKPDVDYTLTYQDNTKVGNATVILTGTGYYSGTVSLPFVIEKMPIERLTIANISSVQYTGSPIRAEVKLYNGEHRLALYKDYTVEFNNNTAVGTAHVTIIGLENYSGSVEKTFTIKRRSLGSLTYASISQKFFADDLIEPTPTIKHGSRTLKADVDYTVSYQDNYDVGTALVLIQGIGNYSGTAELKFDIVEYDPEKLSVSEFKAVTYNGKARKALPKVWYGNVRLKNGVDYTLSYKNNRYAGVGTVYIKLKGDYEGKSTLTQAFVIKPKSIKTLTFADIPAQKYTGKAKTPNPSIRMNSKLKKGRDYTVSYTNNVKKGTATVTIRGIGNFKGTVKKTFVIK